MVDGAQVFLDAVLGDVPAAVMAGGGLVVTGIAIQGAAVEELLQAGTVFGGQLPLVLG